MRTQASAKERSGFETLFRVFKLIQIYFYKSINPTAPTGSRSANLLDPDLALGPANPDPLNGGPAEQLFSISMSTPCLYHPLQEKQGRWWTLHVLLAMISVALQITTRPKFELWLTVCEPWQKWMTPHIQIRFCLLPPLRSPHCWETITNVSVFLFWMPLPVCDVAGSNVTASRYRCRRGLRHWQ